MDRVSERIKVDEACMETIGAEVCEGGLRGFSGKGAMVTVSL